MSYKIKVTPELIKQLKPFWAKFKKSEGEYYKAVNKLETEMNGIVKIKGFLEIYHCDGEGVGIGEVYRHMQLILGEELE